MKTKIKQFLLIAIICFFSSPAFALENADAQKSENKNFFQKIQAAVSHLQKRDNFYQAKQSYGQEKIEINCYYDDRDGIRITISQKHETEKAIFSFLGESYDLTLVDQAPELGTIDEFTLVYKNNAKEAKTSIKKSIKAPFKGPVKQRIAAIYELVMGYATDGENPNLSNLPDTLNLAKLQEQIRKSFEPAPEKNEKQ